jgi:hypothetical protein
MSPHTPTRALSTEQVTWCSAHMQMQDTSMRLNPTAEQMGGLLLKYAVAAMGYPRLIYWPTTSFVDDLKRRATTKQPQHWAFGNTHGDRCSFASLLMILALSTWASCTSTISSWSYKSTTKSKPIWRVTSLRVSMFNRTSQASEYTLT